VGNGFLVKALEKGDLSVLGPINSYKSVVGLVTGIFLLAEFPNVWGLMGTALIIFGSYFVLDTTEDRFTWALLKRKAIQFRIWAMVLTGIEAVFVKKVILATSTLISFFSWCWFGTFFALLFLLVEKRSMPATTARISWADAGRFLCLASCVALMVFTTAYTFQQMDVGYALALFQLSTLVSVILGFKIFREQDIRKKLLGSVIMIIGSVVIILMQDK
jgi:drug/metabolite transporter (DMT)-like permease